MRPEHGYKRTVYSVADESVLYLFSFIYLSSY